MEVLVGADPEFFLKKDGKFVSAYGIIPGTKKNPHKVEGGAVQVDGMAIEFNINPASTAEEFVENINLVLGELRKMVPEEYEFCFEPVADFGQEYIDAQPEEARELGCDPDFNVYTGRYNDAPDGNLGFRTAAGHIHVGWTKDMSLDDKGHIEACEMMVKELDWRLGVASPAWDLDRRRVSMYGHAGTMRVKSYGVEYRTLSNAWLNHPELWEGIFNSVQNAFDHLLNHGEHTSISRMVKESRPRRGGWCPHILVRQYITERFEKIDQPWVYPMMGLFKEYQDDPRALERVKQPVKNKFIVDEEKIAVFDVDDHDWDIDVAVEADWA